MNSEELLKEIQEEADLHKKEVSTAYLWMILCMHNYYLGRRKIWIIQFLIFIASIIGLIIGMGIAGILLLVIWMSIEAITMKNIVRSINKDIEEAIFDLFI